MKRIISLTLPIALCSNQLLAKEERELIVLASALHKSTYYEDVRSEIMEFHIEYAKKISQSDNVLIFTDKHQYPEYVKYLGKEKVIIAPMLDIWMRDFTLSNTTNPIMFRYTPEGQGGGKKAQSRSDAVQEQFAEIITDAGLSFLETDLLNDGGNIVDDYAGNIVVSRKFLRDNSITENEGRKRLRKFPGIKNVAFIDVEPGEIGQGKLEHADGIVSFIDKNTLMVNTYPDSRKYSQKLKKDLRQGLPGVKIHEIVTPYNGSKVYDKKFGSACGLYTNALVTPNRIYFPQFGIPEDKVALKKVRSISSREVIPVKSSQVCHMGGGVRCMSWQLRGKNAKALLKYFKKNK